MWPSNYFYTCHTKTQFREAVQSHAPRWITARRTDRLLQLFRLLEHSECVRIPEDEQWIAGKIKFYDWHPKSLRADLLFLQSAGIVRGVRRSKPAN